MKLITIEDCEALERQFEKFCSHVEQHDFANCYYLQSKMKASIDIWKQGGINQLEANAMFRVVLRFMGKDFYAYEMEGV